jgi:hypothetical protein
VHLIEITIHRLNPVRSCGSGDEHCKIEKMIGSTEDVRQMILAMMSR